MAFLLQKWWAKCRFQNDRIIFVEDMFFYRAKQCSKYYFDKDLERHQAECGLSREDVCQVCLAKALRANQVVDVKHISNEEYQQLQHVEKKPNLDDEIDIRYVESNVSSVVKFQITLKSKQMKFDFEFVPDKDTVDSVVDEMITELHFVPTTYSATLKKKIQEKLSEQTNDDVMVVVIKTSKRNRYVMWKIPSEDVREFKNFIKEKQQRISGHPVLDQTTMESYLFRVWDQMKKNATIDETQIRKMWLKIPPALRTSWFSQLIDAEVLAMYYEAPWEIQEEMSEICPWVAMEDVADEKEWGDSLYQNNSNSNSVYRSDSHSLSEQRLVDYVLRQSLITAEQQQQQPVNDQSIILEL